MRGGLWIHGDYHAACCNVYGFYGCRYKHLLQRKEDLEELEKNVKEQQNKMALENQAHQSTADQCKLLKEENDRSDYHKHNWNVTTYVNFSIGVYILRCPSAPSSD